MSPESMEKGRRWEEKKIGGPWRKPLAGSKKTPDFARAFGLKSFLSHEVKRTRFAFYTRASSGDKYEGRNPRFFGPSDLNFNQRPGKMERGSGAVAATFTNSGDITLLAATANGGEFFPRLIPDRQITSTVKMLRRISHGSGTGISGDANSGDRSNSGDFLRCRRYCSCRRYWQVGSNENKLLKRERENKRGALINSVRVLLVFHFIYYYILIIQHTPIGPPPAPTKPQMDHRRTTPGPPPYHRCTTTGEWPDNADFRPDHRREGSQFVDRKSECTHHDLQIVKHQVRITVSDGEISISGDVLLQIRFLLQIWYVLLQIGIDLVVPATVVPAVVPAPATVVRWFGRWCGDSGDDPQKVKTKLKQWAQMVSCSIVEASSHPDMSAWKVDGINNTNSAANK
ncbi:hypothetical protein LXL04_004787 [Taraxacum kok-saghyz]